jgi:ElaB/YqjD/DUF883 family membrane-anchored ribosome-binding protein
LNRDSDVAPDDRECPAEVWERVEAVIARRPLVAIGVAGAIGIILGCLVKRRDRPGAIQ